MAAPKISDEWCERKLAQLRACNYAESPHRSVSIAGRMLTETVRAPANACTTEVFETPEDWGYTTTNSFQLRQWGAA